MTKQDLKQAFCIEREIKSKEDQLAALYSLAEKSTVYSTRASSGKGGKTDRVGDFAAKISDMKNAINEDIEKLIAAKQNIAVAIKQLDDSRQRLVLEKRYLSYNPWLKIALDMNYSLDNIYVIHRKAVERLQLITVNSVL